MYVGKKGYSNDSSDYNAAAAMLAQVRKDVGLFSYNGYIDDLASGQICVALGYGGDFNNADRRARAAGNRVHIVAPLPPGGVQFGFESMVIPADAPHPQNALAPSCTPTCWPTSSPSRPTTTSRTACSSTRCARATRGAP